MDAGTAVGGLLGCAGLFVVYLACGCHTVPQGHVGVYWQFGRLLKTTTDPGIHFTYPVITHWEPIQITMQTDKVEKIPCGTRGGTMISFDRIEVVNRLRKEAVYDILAEFGTQYDKTWIYDKLHHEMNQFCSAHTLQDIYIDKFDKIDETMQANLQESCKQYAPGLEIISLRVTKPKIPAAVLRNYEAMEEQRTKSMVAEQTQKLVTIEAETKKQKEIFETEIRIQRQVMEAEALLSNTRTQNTIKLETQKAETDAITYILKTRAESNVELLTPEFLILQWANAITNSSRIFFGPALKGATGALAQVANSLLGG